MIALGMDTRNVRKEKMNIAVVLIPAVNIWCPHTSEPKKAIARLENIDVSSKLGRKMEGSATAVLQGIDIYVPLKGIIDLNKEVERLKEKITLLDADIEKIKQRISGGKNIPENISDFWN